MEKDAAEGLLRKLAISPRYSQQHVAGVLSVDGVVAVVLHFPNQNFLMPERVAIRLSLIHI